MTIDKRGSSASPTGLELPTSLADSLRHHILKRRRKPSSDWRLMAVSFGLIAAGVFVVGPEEFVQYRYVGGGFLIGAGIQTLAWFGRQYWASRTGEPTRQRG